MDLSGVDVQIVVAQTQVAPFSILCRQLLSCHQPVVLQMAMLQIELMNIKSHGLRDAPRRIAWFMPCLA